MTKINTSRLTIHIAADGSCRTQLPGGVFLGSPSLNGMFTQLSTYDLTHVRQINLFRTCVTTWLLPRQPLGPFVKPDPTALPSA